MTLVSRILCWVLFGIELMEELSPIRSSQGRGFLHKFGPCRIYGGTFPRLNQTGEGFLRKFAPLSAQNRATFRSGPSDPNRWPCSTGWNLQLNCGFCSEVRNAVPLSAHKTETPILGPRDSKYRCAPLAGTPNADWPWGFEKR